MVKTFFDLKSLLVFSLFYFDTNRTGAGNEHWKNNIFSDHGILTSLRVEEMYSSLPRRLQSSILYLFKSILHNGICTINISRKSQRY